MRAKTDFLLGDLGTKLFYRYWLPDNPDKIVAIIHGLGEHSRRYASFAQPLVDENIAVFALDHRGHGKSQGKRGHTRSYTSLLNDVEEFLKAIRAQFTDLPIVLYGHSMGGNIVGNYMLRMNTNELAGYVLSAPYFQLNFEPPKWKVSLAKVLSNILPSLSQPNGLVTAHLSKIASEVKKYEEDPLIHPQITVRLYNELADAALFALNTNKEITLPGMIYHGGADQIISPKGSEFFSKKQPLTTWKSYPTAYHEPHNDEEAQEVSKDLIAWLSKTIK